MSEVTHAADVISPDHEISLLLWSRDLGLMWCYVVPGSEIDLPMRFKSLAANFTVR